LVCATDRHGFRDLAKHQKAQNYRLIPMADPNFTAYLSVATGIIGAIAGLTGCVMGYMGLRRNDDFKPLDLRFELQKLIKQMEDGLVHTEKLLNIANEPRQIISAATGLRELMKWDEDFERDKRDFNEIKRLALFFTENHDALDFVELEPRLIVARRLAGQLAKLRTKYAPAVRAD
jgi:hypothetical protein